MANDNAGVQIPVIIDIDKACADAAARVGKAMAPLRKQIEANTLQLRLHIDTNKKMSLGRILDDATLSTKQLQTALNDVDAQITKIASKKKSFDLIGGLTDKEKKLLEAYAILEKRITGIGGTSTVTSRIITLNIERLRTELSKLEASLKTAAKGSKRFQNLNNQILQTKNNIANLRAELVRNNSEMATTNMTMEKQSALWSQLRGLAGMYLSVFGGLRLLKNIRETTAEFGLQRVALGSILQDTQKATSLFKQLKQAALESPFEIKDLVTYTKQLAAYQIETDKLFDTTKKLADVSAGLGVDMGRLILAYGQVRAAAVLRGQELRQFTEAGVPLVDKLAEKFSQLRGEMVSTGEVFELISKRAVPFSMISEIFDDMTEKGGIFYDMQKKQSETLYGQWQKLKDAASIMYDEIGNTSTVQWGMRSVMSLTMTLLRNWQDVASVLKIVGLGYLGLKAYTSFLPILVRNTTLAAKAQNLLSQAQTAATAGYPRLSQVLKRQSELLMAAATATNRYARAWAKFKYTMASWGPALIVTAITALGAALYRAFTNADKLNKELSKIGTDAALRVEQSVRSFERLAATATDTAKSVDEQSLAIEELQRTFGNIIPAQKLQISYLQSLKGNYEELTDAIKENIRMEAQRQKIDTIKDTYSSQIDRKQKQIKNVLKSTYGFSDDEVEAAFKVLEKAVDDGTYDLSASIRDRGEQLRNILEQVFTDKNFPDLFKRVISDTEGWTEEAGPLLKLVQGLALRYDNLNKAMKSVTSTSADLIAQTGEYAKSIDDMRKEISNAEKTVMIRDPYAERAQKNLAQLKESYDYQQDVIQERLAVIKKTLRDFYEGINIDWDKVFVGDFIDFKELSKHISEIKPIVNNATKEVQKEYEKLMPTDAFTFGMREQFKTIAESVKAPLGKIGVYLKKSDENMETYVQRLHDGVKTYQDVVKQYNTASAGLAAGIQVFKFVSKEDANEALLMIEALNKMLEGLKDWEKKSGGAGSKSYQKPKFITDMEEAIKFMQDFKKGYDDLRKYMGSEGALGKEAEIMLGRGLGLGLDAQQQKKAAENLSEWYQEMIDKTMAEMKKRGARGTTVTDLLGFDAGKNKALRDFQKLLQSLFDAKTDLDTTNWKNSLEKALNDLAEKVKHGEAAKKFYDSIFEMTGDKEMAMNMAISVYGDAGQDVAKNIQEQMRKTFVLDKGLIEDAGESYGDIALAVEKAISAGNYGELEKYLQFVAVQNRSTATSVVKDWQKTGEETAKNFAKLALKFDELEQQRVNITNKAAKERETVEKGLAQELIGINAYYNKKIDEAEDAAEIERLAKAKDAAIAEAKARADALKQGITNEEQYELSKLTREYRLFFSTVGVLSKESARRVYNETRKMLTDQFVHGQKTLAQYKRDLKELDEQMKKNNQSQNLFVSYLTGGVDGLVSKIKDYSEGLSGLVNTIGKNKEDGTAIFGEGDKDYIDKMGKIFGGKVFGVSGRKNVFDKLIAQTGGDAEKMKAALEGASQAIAAMGEGFAQGVAIADLWVQNIGNAVIELDKLANTGEEAAGWWNDFANVLMKIPTLGFSKSSDAGDRLAEMNEYAMQGFEKFKSGNFVGAFADTIRSWSVMFGPSVKAINREIKKQQNLLDELTYQYGRLDVAIDKAFGESYIYNYNKQLENLAAQQQAYLRQAELERSKGKKKDKDKIKEYEDAARSTADKIADMQSQLSEFFAGTDLTSAAEDFATAWIEAYQQFANTTDAMRDKFEDMIKSMVTRSLAAKLMQSILQPLFDQIDAMAKDGDLSAYEISEIARQAPEYVAKMNEAMTTMANDLSAAGYNLRGTATNLTGISRDIAGASEESILGLSAAINTQNFYISRIPSIDEKMSQIIALMGGNVAQGGAPQAETPETDLKLQYLSYLPTMASDVNEILVNLKRVISPKGASTATHYIAMR